MRSAALVAPLANRGLATVAERNAEAIVRAARHAPAGSFYALECSRALGLGESGAVRVGLAPYTDDDDVDRLFTALRRISGG